MNLEEFSQNGTHEGVEFRIQDANMPYIIASNNGISTNGIRLLTNKKDIFQVYERINNKLKAKGLDETHRIAWFKDYKDETNHPIIGVWTNSNFDLFGFFKAMVKVEGTDTQEMHISQFCFKSQALF